MVRLPPPEDGATSSIPRLGRQHPLLLWFDLLGSEDKGPLLYYWLSLGAYYLLLFACSWFVLQWFRRGRPWARARSFLVGKSKGGVGGGDGGDGGAGKAKDAKPPVLLYKESARNRRLLSKTTVLRQPYVPSPWLGHRLGGHMQSFMFATWCPPGERGAVNRLVSREDRVVSSFDGGTFRMDWFDLSGTSLPSDAPVVFVLPGVVGRGTNVYIRHLAAHLSINYGWRVVAKCWRGIGAGLTSRRPETWDHAALSDARDAIRHVRAAVGKAVPMMGVGFSFGGCLLTAIAGSVPAEEHGLCGVVSISGLFDMSSMMRHIAEQYAYPYGFANTKVTVHNYRKFKVLETLTADEVSATDGGDGSGDGGGVGIESTSTVAATSCACEVECVSVDGLKAGGATGRSSGRSSSNSLSSKDSTDDATDRAVVMMMAARAEEEDGENAKGGTVSSSSSGSGSSSSTEENSRGRSESRMRSKSRSRSRSVEDDNTGGVVRSFPSSSASPSSLPYRRGRKASRRPPTTEATATGVNATSKECETATITETTPEIVPAVAPFAASFCSSPPGNCSSSSGSNSNNSGSSSGSGRSSSCRAASSKDRDGDEAAGVVAGAGAGRRVRRSLSPPPTKAGFVTARQMAAMKDPTAFHEALTLPFTGDASVEAYFERIEAVMGPGVSSVTVPTLCLLAKDDPLCPPKAWVGALERAAKSDGIVVAITEHGGHCGWFDGLGAGSWLDRAAGDFLASALELSKEATARAARVDDGHGGVSVGTSGGGGGGGVAAAAAAAVGVGVCS